MNPIEEFYKELERHNELHKFLKSKYLVKYEIVVGKDGRDTIKISATEGFRKNFDKKNYNLIMSQINRHLELTKRNIEDEVLKKSSEILEEKRQRVIRDFKIEGGKLNL